MFKSSTYSSSKMQDSPFSLLQQKNDALKNKKNKVYENSVFITNSVAIAATWIWILFASFFWLNGMVFSGSVVIGLFVLVTFSVLAVLFVNVMIFWSEQEPNRARIAEKVFSKDNLQGSSEYIFYNYNSDSHTIREVFRKKLDVSCDQVDYMQLLIKEGYTGSVKDLVTIVKTI